MRSVVVVLPASTCAMIPMLRVRSSETARDWSGFVAIVRAPVVWLAPPSGSPCVRLPAVVRECLVGVGHLVNVFALLHRVAAVLRGVDDLVREAIHHRLLVALARVLDDPAHAQ